MAKAPRKPDYDAIATDILAEVVDQFRGRGLRDEALIAVGAAGVRQALAQWDPNGGQRFETWCKMWVQKAIELALDQRGSAQAKPMKISDGNFAKEVLDREARLVDKLAKALAHHRDELLQLVGEAKVSSYGLAFFDLFSERFEDVIEPWITEQLSEVEEFMLSHLELPAEGATTWAMEVALDDDKTVRLELDGWTLQATKRA